VAGDALESFLSPVTWQSGGDEWERLLRKRIMKMIDASDLVSESEFQRTVIAAAEAYRWLVAHFPDSRKSHGEGLPDLVMVHRDTGKVLFVELKANKGTMSPAQKVWAEAIGSGASQHRIWRPSTSWGDIEAILYHGGTK
tara:strand:- start:295 stop:714 length:420 start_codon:yes stop_codon:yes gene_type:complete